ncbi:MAG: hypothetical protein EOO00_10615 [Chitinophagaceae bacterium]|nr:MAG: hypothetical protein EOO00_10615 [Chitinophagaceae bacterium]
MQHHENATSSVVLGLTQNYLQQLSPGELIDQFNELSHQFSARLDYMDIDDLKKLQYYLRLISAELKAREA